MIRLVMVALAVCACTPAGVSIDVSHKGAAGKPVAKFAGGSLSDAELQTQFAQMNPYVRARYQTPEQRREYVEGLVRFELLAARAAKDGIANETDVVATLKKLMVQRLLKKQMDETPTPIAETAIAAFYEKHKSDYVKPEMTRLAQVFFKKDQREAAANTLKDATALAPLDYAGFAKLARERSQDSRTQPIEGDLRYLSDEELAAQTGPEVVTAAKELKQVGEVLPRLVETAQGLHILKLQGRQIALNLSLEQVKVQIQKILEDNARNEKYRAFVTQVESDGAVKIDDSALAAVPIDFKAPPLDSKTPPPGFMPAPAAEKADR